jgi:hypothetical protein
LVDATKTLSIKRSNCFKPPEEAKAEKLRLNKEADPAVEV